MWSRVEARGHCWVSSVWLHWLAKELQGSSCLLPTPSTGFQCWNPRLTSLFWGFRDPDLSSCTPQQALYPRNCVCSLFLGLLNQGSCTNWPFQGLSPDFRPTYTMRLSHQKGEPLEDWPHFPHKGLEFSCFPVWRAMLEMQRHLSVRCVYPIIGYHSL